MPSGWRGGGGRGPPGVQCRRAGRDSSLSARNPAPDLHPHPRPTTCDLWTFRPSTFDLRPGKETVREDHRAATARADRDDAARGRVLGGAPGAPARRLPGAQARGQPLGARQARRGALARPGRLPAGRHRRGRQRPRRPDRPRDRLHRRPPVPRPARRRGPARDRAHLGQALPPRGPRPQGRGDDGDQRDRLRPLGPARPLGRRAGLPPARRPGAGELPGLRQRARLLAGARAGAGAPESWSPRATPPPSGSSATGRPTGGRGSRATSSSPGRCARRSARTSTSCSTPG